MVLFKGQCALFVTDNKNTFRPIPLYKPTFKDQFVNVNFLIHCHSVFFVANITIPLDLQWLNLLDFQKGLPDDYWDRT